MTEPTNADRSEMTASSRAKAVLVLLSCLAVAAIVVSCSKSESSEAKLKGEVGNQTQEIVNDLKPAEKDCIQGSADAASAAGKCLTRERFAEQVVEQIKASPVWATLDKDTADELAKCYRKAIEDLDESDIGDLAGSDKSTMRRLQEKLSTCVSPTTPSSKYSSVASAIS